VRVSGNGPPISCPAVCAAGPLTRITDIAAGGRPLDKAKMVSAAITASGKDWSDYRSDVPGAVVDHLRRNPQDHQ